MVHNSSLKSQTKSNFLVVALFIEIIDVLWSKLLLAARFLVVIGVLRHVSHERRLTVMIPFMIDGSCFQGVVTSNIVTRSSGTKVSKLYSR